MDELGRSLAQRVRSTLAANPELGRKGLQRAIRRGQPWVSEFLNEARPTNDLRLVIRMAKYLGVSVSFLIGEGAPQRSRELDLLVEACASLTPAQVDALRHIAKTFAVGLPPTGPEDAIGPVGGPALDDETRRKRPQTRTTGRRKHASFGIPGKALHR